MRVILLIAVVSVATLGSSLRAGESRAVNAKIEIADADGAKFRPLELNGKKAAVLIFIAHDCPISNTFIPEINRLCAAYTPKNIAFYAVHCDADTTVEQIRQHTRQFVLQPVVLVDKACALPEQTGATVTPEAVVIGADGNVFYRGRIDDRYVAYGKKRDEPTTHELQAALDAVLDGKPAPKPAGDPVGCFIFGVKKN